MDMTSVSHMGLDCRRKFSRITARDWRNAVLWRTRIDHKDRDALREYLGKCPVGTPAVLEGTFGWSWVSDELRLAGLDPHLASSCKAAAWREARGLAKSDRIDSDLLSELWTQQPRWWEVWLVPPEVRGQREWMRYRMALVSIQTSLKNRTHAVLHRHGIMHEFSDLFSVAGRKFLRELGENSVRLPESGRATLKGYLELLDQLRRQIALVTRQLHRQVVTSPGAQRLRSLPGISWILAHTIMAEVGRIERFANAKHLVSYSLLAPRADDSAVEQDEGPPIGRHVGRAGRRTLKWAWIEAAHGAVHSGGPFRAIYDRITDGGKKNRGRGNVAVAHELCRLGYVLIKKNVDYREDRPERPGQKKGTQTHFSSGNGPARAGYGRCRQTTASDLIVSEPPAPDEIVCRAHGRQHV